MRIPICLLLAVLGIATAGASASKIRVSGDGGYTGIVIKISDDGSVPEDKCPEIIDNIGVSSCFIQSCWRKRRLQ